jgi:hypothetical protein
MGILYSRRELCNNRLGTGFSTKVFGESDEGC